VLDDGDIVGRILLSPVAPQNRPWMWASCHNGKMRRAANGYGLPLRRAAGRLTWVFGRCTQHPGLHGGVERAPSLP
jgi:hypothetical protein